MKTDSAGSYEKSCIQMFADVFCLVPCMRLSVSGHTHTHSRCQNRERERGAGRGGGGGGGAEKKRNWIVFFSNTSCYSC